MADTIKSSDKLYMGFNDHNNKTQYITALPHARSTNNEASVREVANYIVDNGIFLDKEGYSYTSVVTAYRETSSTRSLDIE